MNPVQNSVKNLLGFLGDLKTPKFHSEINWSLATPKNPSILIYWMVEQKVKHGINAWNRGHRGRCRLQRELAAQIICFFVPLNRPTSVRQKGRILDILPYFLFLIKPNLSCTNLHISQVHCLGSKPTTALVKKVLDLVRPLEQTSSKIAKFWLSK